MSRQTVPQMSSASPYLYPAIYTILTPSMLGGFELAMPKGPSNQCPCSSRLRDANGVCGEPEPYWLCDGILMKLIRLAGLHWRIFECTLYSECVCFGAPLHWRSLSCLQLFLWFTFTWKQFLTPTLDFLMSLVGHCSSLQQVLIPKGLNRLIDSKLVETAHIVVPKTTRPFQRTSNRQIGCSSYDCTLVGLRQKVCYIKETSWLDLK